MASGKYDAYISRDIVKQSKYSQITAPMVEYRGDNDGSETDLAFEWSCITKPFSMDEEPEVYDRDQFLLFASSNIEDTTEFSAEVRLPLGSEKQIQTITEPTFVYIPAGLAHGPIEFKSVRKPITLWKWELDTKYSENWQPSDYSGYLAKPGMVAMDSSAATDAMVKAASEEHPPNILINEMDGTPLRYIRTPPSTGVSCWCKQLGIQANISTGYFVVNNRDYCTIEPVHYHTQFDEWLIFLGGNPMDITETDFHVEMFWGLEQEMQVVNSTCVAHVPPGLVHIGQDHRRVGKPYYESISVAGTGDYFATCDKIVVSREERGDPMIPKGARDWLPSMNSTY
jgi:hypothetical protein